MYSKDFIYYEDIFQKFGYSKNFKVGYFKTYSNFRILLIYFQTFSCYSKSNCILDECRKNYLLKQRKKEMKNNLVKQAPLSPLLIAGEHSYDKK